MSLLQRVRTLSYRSRVSVIVALAVIVLMIAVFVPPIPQDPSYHDFADSRTLWGVANFADVISNAPFLLVGIVGFAFLLRQPANANTRRDLLWRPFLVYFAGVGLVAFGSAYYHWHPINETLFWDRLPMTIAFMALFTAFILDRIDQRLGPILLPVLVVIGIASVIYWSASEMAGQGDLRAYAVVQFFPMLAIPIICLVFPPGRLHARYVIIMGCLYGLAKLFEHFDHETFALLGQSVSGHSLKHLAAAAAAYVAVPMLRYPVQGTPH